MAIIFPLVAAIIALPILSPATFPRLGLGLLILLMILVFSPLVAVPHIYLMRALRPLVADARRAKERIKLREQLSKIAVSVSGKVLVVSLVAGLILMGAGVLLLLDAFLEGRVDHTAVFFVVTGGLATAYCGYLVRLRGKLKRIAHR